MKAWSYVLTAHDLTECAKAVNEEFPGCRVWASFDDPTCLVCGPNAGALRFDHVSLRARNGRPSNTGNRGSDASEPAASWTEWGWWLVRLFEIDPDARLGQYDGVDDFHEKTGRRFVDPRSARERQLLRRGILPRQRRRVVSTSRGANESVHA